MNARLELAIHRATRRAERDAARDRADTRVIAIGYALIAVLAWTVLL